LPPDEECGHVSDAAPTGAARAPLTSRRGEWSAGSRLRRVRASHSYGLVLAIVMVDFFFASLAPDGDWSTSMLVLIESALLIMALWTSGLAGAASHPVLIVALIGICAAAARLLRHGDATAAAVGIVAGLMVVASIVVIARGVLDQQEVNKQSVLGALCVYALIGLFFQFLYSVFAALGSQPFFTNGTDGTRALRTYFSYVTLATLGYGDYTPAGNGGHTVAIVEALSGQLYLVIVITVLVGRLGQKRPGQHSG